MSKGIDGNLFIAINIADRIRNGIETEEGIRKFDSIDFYYLIGNNSAKQFLNDVNSSLEPIDSKTLITFFQSHIGSEKEMEKDFFLSRKYTVNAKIKVHEPLIKSKAVWSSEKIYEWVQGTGEVFDDEDKYLVFDYLEENNIPLTESTFNDGKLRVVNGLIKKPKQKLYNKMK